MNRDSNTLRAPARTSRSSQGVEIIKQRIKQGIYKPGEQLPSLRALSSELNLSVPALNRAVRQLEREAILESRHGVGNIILDSADCSSTPLLFGFVQPYFNGFSSTLQLYMEEALDSRANLCVMKSTRNDPARERREIERLLESGVSGLLLWPVDNDTNSVFLQEIAAKIPLVLVDRTIEGLQIPAVVLDYKEAGRQIMRRLAQLKKQRVLMVCDPADISSFRQLKQGLRTEAESSGKGMTLEIIDFPVTALIDAFHAGNYALADECLARMVPMLSSGQFDALLCPQDEWFDKVFVDSHRTDVLDGLSLVTLRTHVGKRSSRRYHELGIEEWIQDTSLMLVQALNILQDMTLSRCRPKRVIKLPIHLDTSPG